MNDFVFDSQRFIDGTYGDDTLSVTSSNSYVYAYSGNDNDTIISGGGNHSV